MLAFHMVKHELLFFLLRIDTSRSSNKEFFFIKSLGAAVLHTIIEVPLILDYEERNISVSRLLFIGFPAKAKNVTNKKDVRL